ncbi:Catalase KatE-intracellular protease [Candidatus Syntrophocurvum alkaliphilum]|uniref:Catalase n=1 Tax=Candidatus Syntrophocurvum alkaliphilum TaxID=2293317 RepID=A0A6I6D5C9_9FIRM|nr:catalase [Candidatus Syntrophocurvum alkaliphilum]QGT98623.1 Catalase KatE-intracellular protease [Candidatus Syntrophocurvum alkaliphilum]
MDSIQKQNKAAKDGKKDEQLDNFRVDHKDQKLTTNHGVRVSNTDDSLKAGNRGPTLMEDFHFREKMTHFDHERIPERVVHARGSGAHGYFQVYEPMNEFTKAKFLQDPSVKTPVFVRFSTVVGSRGSADTVRDVRGFATKFYTEDGNYDLVANNIPIFFIQDAIKFPDVVHSIKPEPNNEIPQASAAHDTFWDFVVSTPELAHMVMWLLSDRAIPRSFRMMEGFGVNTFRFVNEQGKGRFVKFHWKPLLGVHSLVWDEAQKLGGKDPDFHRRDLWRAIEMGEYPEFELGVQMIEEEDEFEFDFDILDATKFWPEEIVPVKRIGKMTLNRNVDNFFAETEQVAFHAGHVVPGIDFTNDPLLQGRLFSYLDTQLIRLGGPNFHEIPINRSLAQVHNNQRDGYHRMTIDKGPVSYSPNFLQSNAPHPTPDEENGYVHYTEKVDGRKIRERNKSFNDHYSQAKLFWNSMSDAEKQHIVDAFHFEIGGVKNKQIRQLVVNMFSNVNENLAAQIAEGVGVTAPPLSSGSDVTDSSPAVSQENTVKSPQTRWVGILVENGFNYSEIIQVIEELKKAGVNSEIVSKYQGTITCSNGNAIEVDKNYLTTGSIMYDAVYVGGGQQSIETLLTHGDALNFINEAYKHCKAIGATNEGVDLLVASQIQSTKIAGPDTEGELVTHLGVVTIRNENDMTNFSQEFVNSIAEHRHWTREVENEMVPA